MAAFAELPALYAALALAFTLLLTVFSRRQLSVRRDEYRATLLYFGFFFLLLFALPAAAILIINKAGMEVLGDIGLRFGRWKLGLALAAAAVPLALAGALVGGRDKGLSEFYPFAPSACRGGKRLVLYETAYLILYYLPWEFVFRGLLFFPLAGAVGLLPALAIQTMLSTLYHIGHPDTEIAASLAAGFLFGLIAYHTQSVLYTTAIHAMFGIATDLASCRRRRGPKP
jgi:membrane protease YdiL (CAAX protease family)